MANEFVAKNGLISQNNSTVTGSLTVTGGITGSLSGTSSFATSASFAQTSSFITTAQTASYVLNAVSSSFATSASFASTVPASGVIGLNSFQIATGSVSASVSPTQFTITSGSVTEFVVRGTGVTIGNTTTDTHFITGSAQITGSLGVTGLLTATQIGAGAAPSGSVRLDVRAQGALSTDTVFRVHNSAATQNLMSITGDGQIVIGLSASINLATNASPQDSVVIGRGASAGLYATAVGAASIAEYYSSVAIGRATRAGGESVAIGYGAIAYNSAIYPTLAIGYGANASGIYSGVISIGNPGITNALGSSFAFGINNSGNAQSLFFNRNTNIVLRSNTALTSGTHFDANATNTITIHSGSIPTTTVSGAFQMYAATGSLTDNTRPHFRTSNGTTVWLGDESRLFNVTASNVMIGATSSLALFTSVNSTVNTGTTTIYAFPTASYDGVFIDYTARSGSNARAGQIMGIRSGSAVNFTEITTTDFGSTTGLTFGMSISASSMIVSASAATAGWTVKTIIRSI